MDSCWLCQAAGTPIPAWDSELLVTTPAPVPQKGCFCGGVSESRYCPIKWADRPPRITVHAVCDHLKISVTHADQSLCWRCRIHPRAEARGFLLVLP